MYQVDTGHEAMITKPREVVEILLKIDGDG